MKNILLLLAIALTSCTAQRHTMSGKVTDIHVDDLRRSKSYLVLDTSDTLICLDKSHRYEIGKEYSLVYTKGFRKQLK